MLFRKPAVYLADRRIGDETLLRNYNDSGGVLGFVEYGYYPGFASLVMGLGETGSVHVYEKFAGHTGSAGGADGEAVGKGRDALFTPLMGLLSASLTAAP